MNKLFNKKTISILMLICIVWVVLFANAASVSAAVAWTTLDNRLNISISAGTEDGWGYDSSSGVLTGTLSATKAGNCDATESNTTFEVKNLSSRSVLCFRYSFNLGRLTNKSGATIGEAGEDGWFYVVLASGGTTEFTFHSTTNPEEKCTLTLSAFSLTPSTAVSVGFLSTGGGDFTVAGPEGSGVAFEVGASGTRSLESADTYTLTAEPDTGYKLLGWKLNGAWISREATITRSFANGNSVEAVFVTQDSPVFQIGEELFGDLNAALDYAQGHLPALVLLTEDGTLPAGTYDISDRVTLLIPDDEEEADCSAATVVTTHVMPSVYRTLGMADGAKITIQGGGAVCVQSRISANGYAGTNSWNGTPSGPYGHIAMQQGSLITVEDGAVLNCFGYISGTGAVTANSGAIVRECFQIRGWRAPATVLDLVKGKTVFPFNQYYVQNIEVPLTIYYGAEERLVSGATALGQVYDLDVPFLVSDGSGMFKINGGYVVKDYLEEQDRLEIAIYGGAELSAIEVSGVPSDFSDSGYISSADFNLPITNNLTLNVQEGVFQINQPIDLLPGTEILVAEDAVLQVTQPVYLYDADEWSNYAGKSLKFVPVGYSAAHGTETVRTEADLTDAKLDVAGAVVVGGSKLLYTTTGGASITGSDGGQIRFTAGQGSANSATRQWNEVSNSADSIAANPAKLKNADGTYIRSSGASAGTVYTYNGTSGTWSTDGSGVSYDVTITWGAFSFTYTPSFTWDGANMKYVEGEGTWTCSGNNSVAVQNGSASSGSVSVAYAFTKAAGLSWTPGMRFYQDSAMTKLLSGTVSLAPGANKTVYMMLYGAPKSAFADMTTVGTVSVTVSAGS